jgi:hypothetical protein
MGTVVMPHVMSRALSLRGCGGRCVAVRVVAWPRWVSYCGWGCCMAAFCVAGAVIAWLRWVSCCGWGCCVAVVGIVLWSGLLRGCVLCRRRCHCVAAVGVVAPCCVAVGVVALRGRSGCHRAMWDRGDWTAKEEISRKKRKEKKKNAPEGMPVRVAWRCSPRVSHRCIITVGGGAMVHPGGWYLD